VNDKFLVLTSHTFGKIKKPLFAIAAIMAVVEALGLTMAALSRYNYYLTYEQMIDRAFVPYIFLSAIFAVTALQMMNFRSFYSKQSGVYTLFTLPVKRKHILYSNLLVSCSAVLFLITVQLILVTVLYFPIESLANNLSVSLVENYSRWNSPQISWDFRYSMDGGLFLALIRNHLLRILLPVTLSGILMLLSVILTFSVMPMYAFATFSDSRVKPQTVGLFVISVVAVSFMFIGGFGYGLVTAAVLYVSDICFILSILNRYKESKVLYRGAEFSRGGRVSSEIEPDKAAETEGRND
jgi:hypothetical protein